MLRKKNYKEEDHFNYHSATVTRSSGKRVILYFKRYRPKQNTTNVSVYQTVQNKGPQPTV